MRIAFITLDQFLSTQMAAMSFLLLLTCVHIAASDDVVNVMKLELGSLVSGNVSLQASDTYSLTGTMVRVILLQWHDNLHEDFSHTELEQLFLD